MQVSGEREREREEKEKLIWVGFFLSWIKQQKVQTYKSLPGWCSEQFIKNRVCRRWQRKSKGIFIEGEARKLSRQWRYEKVKVNNGISIYPVMQLIERIMEKKFPFTRVDVLKCGNQKLNEGNVCAWLSSNAHTYPPITWQWMIEFNRQTFSAAISTSKCTQIELGERKRASREKSNAIKIKSNMMNITIGLSLKNNRNHGHRATPTVHAREIILAGM